MKQTKTKIGKSVSIIETQPLLMIHIMTNNSGLVQLVVFAVLAPGQLQPCPKEAVADPLSKYLL